jgi:hypothetical protein
VWRRSTMPATACSAASTLSWEDLKTIIGGSFVMNRCLAHPGG